MKIAVVDEIHLIRAHRTIETSFSSAPEVINALEPSSTSKLRQLPVCFTDCVINQDDNVTVHLFDESTVNR